MKLAWPWRRAAAPANPADDARAFDASIDVDLRHLDRRHREAALDAIRAKLTALPGAGWISVEPHDATLVRLFIAGSSAEVEGPEWEELRRDVTRAVRQAIPDGAEQGWATPQPMQLGFAEAVAPTGFDALEQLAALASTTRGRKAKVAPPPTPTPAEAEPDEDVLRLARLLALVLPVDGVEQAAAAVRRFGSFAGVLAAPEAELRRLPGLGTHCIAAIKLVHAAAIRLARAGIAERPVLDDPKRLADYLAAALARERIEQFRILFLDENGMLRADEVQAQGTVNHTPVYPREVVRRALALNAASLILVHNHPSGNPEPSREDIDMTKQVAQAAAVMKIGLRDHVIIGNGRWLSFREQGLLD